MFIATKTQMVAHASQTTNRRLSVVARYKKNAVTETPPDIQNQYCIQRTSSDACQIKVLTEVPVLKFCAIT